MFLSLRRIRQNVFAFICYYYCCGTYFPNSFLYLSIIRLDCVQCFTRLSSVFDFTATDEGASADGQSSVRLRCRSTGCQGRTNRTVAAYGGCECCLLTFAHMHIHRLLITIFLLSVYEVKEGSCRVSLLH